MIAKHHLNVHTYLGVFFTLLSQQAGLKPEAPDHGLKSRSLRWAKAQELSSESS